MRSRRFVWVINQPLNSTCGQQRNNSEKHLERKVLCYSGEKVEKTESGFWLFKALLKGQKCYRESFRMWVITWLRA